MYCLRVKSHFDAAHYLEGYDGDCGNLHGHRWVVEVEYQFDSLGSDVDGIAIDFKDIKKALNAILPDHKCLNDVLTVNPTAENLTKYLYDRLSPRVSPLKVTVWETPECSVSYTDP